ncbi:MAG: pyrroline-5-carboxylate reductase [Thiohalomonadaceae bacterium]
MKASIIGFIGGGNMARSLIGGLVADRKDPATIRVSEPDPQQRSRLAESFGVQTMEDNEALVRASDVVVLAVKPQVLAEVCQAIAPAVRERNPLVVSIAAGIRLADMERWLGGKPAIVRTMPNTPAMVQCGATALIANERVSQAQRELAEGIMRAVGIALWLEREEQMDAVTALSGSGPAYFFLVMEALEAAAQELGLSPATARLLTLQTAFGAAKMALESSDDAATLRRRVTSPGGTTEQAIRVLEEGDLRRVFRRALQAASDRSEELARLLGGQA